MNLKNKKGYTTADVVVAILIIVIFAGIIVTLYQNYSNVSKEVERKATATKYAVSLIEEIKKNDYIYFNEENKSKERIVVYDNEPIENDTAYSKTVIIEDYAVEHKDAELGIVKKVKATVNYKLKNEVQSVELNTVISKEN